MRDQHRQTLQAATAEVRLEPAKSARFSGSVPLDDRLAASIPTAGTVYDCPIPPKGRFWPRNRRESGECRLVPFCLALIGLLMALASSLTTAHAFTTGN